MFPQMPEALLPLEGCLEEDGDYRLMDDRQVVMIARPSRHAIAGADLKVLAFRHCHAPA